jgi:hypothetical protein
MKIKTKIKGFNKQKELYFDLDGRDHLEAQKKYPHKIVKSKKTYSRKKKHKGII